MPPLISKVRAIHMRIIKSVLAQMMIGWFALGQTAPNHLEPAPVPFRRGGVGPAMNALLPSQGVELWMIATPAFSTDFSVCIFNSSKDSDHPQFHLRYVKAAKNYLLPAPPPPPPPPGSKKPLKATSQKVPRAASWSVLVDASFVARISDVWSRAIKRTRYSPDTPLHMGLDGCLYAFGADRYIGVTWSPRGEIPSKMVELSEALTELAQSKDQPNAALQAQALSVCAELSKALDAESPSRWH